MADFEVRLGVADSLNSYEFDFHLMIRYGAVVLFCQNSKRSNNFLTISVKQYHIVEI